MTQLTHIRLTDTQLIVLSGATQRPDGVLTLPERLKGMAAQKVATGLIGKRLAKEVRARTDGPIWRRDDNGRAFAMVITKAGRAAIHTNEDQQESAAAKVAVTASEISSRAQPSEVVASLGPAKSPREGSKLAGVIGLLGQSEGASIEDLIAATGWLPHTTRAALTGLRKRGYPVTRERSEAGGSVYRIASAEAAQAA